LLTHACKRERERERERESRELGIFHLVPQFCEECSLGVFVGLCVKGETIEPCSFYLVPYFEEMFIWCLLPLSCLLSLACKGGNMIHSFSFGPTF
jgi:hypothetical protein